MTIARRVIACTAAALMAGCATVRKQDIAAWEGAPVQALDTHPVFLSMPMYKSTTDNGMQVRNYVNSQQTEQCFASVGVHRGGSKDARYSEFVSCSENRIVCNNLFYIQEGKVIRYAPTGNCYTNDSVRPRPPVVAPGAN